ncbi:hypothetical protein BaRGS_00032667 [Batillaria attramentaria]|uniref:Uncharacterized protein n=1 Tax=Batillaria attramentaria TaxID=370345 RepID=A0ABD0JN75_9CAEN
MTVLSLVCMKHPKHKGLKLKLMGGEHNKMRAILPVPFLASSVPAREEENPPIHIHNTTETPKPSAGFTRIPNDAVDTSREARDSQKRNRRRWTEPGNLSQAS